MALVSISDLIVTTDVERQPIVEEQFRKRVALWDELGKRKMIRPHKGGRRIQVEVAVKENDGAQWQSERERMSSIATQPLDLLQYDVKILTTPIVITDLEQKLNTGKAANLDILAQRIENCEDTHVNKIGAEALYGVGIDWGGKAITGLPAYVSNSPTTGVIGGKDRSLAQNAWLRNIYYSSTISQGAPKSAANYVSGASEARKRGMAGGKSANLLICDNIDFGYLELDQRAITRIEKSTDKQDIDYDKLYLTSGVPAICDGGLGGGVPASTTFGIRVEDFEMVYVPDRKNKLLPPRVPQDQLIEVIYMVFFGAFITKRLRHSFHYAN